MDAEQRERIFGILDAMEKEQSARTFGRDDLAKGAPAGRVNRLDMLELVRLARAAIVARL